MYDVFYNAFVREFPFNKSLDDILLDISEFPTAFFWHDITIAIIFLFMAYLLIPKSHIKYKGIITVTCVFVLLLLNNDLTSNFLLKQEHIDNLTQTTGILSYKPYKRYYEYGYYILINDKQQWLVFTLCATDMDKYLGQNITVWHKEDMVYQFSYEGKIICGLKRSNEKVWLNLFLDGVHHVVWKIIFVILLFCLILSDLNSLNSDVTNGKQEDFK